MKGLIPGVLLSLLSTAGWAGTNHVINEQNIASYSVDAFGRERVSSPVELFSSKQQVQLDLAYWTVSNSGTGAATTYATNAASTTLTSGTLAGGFSTVETRTYWPYFAGRSTQCYFTFNFMGGVSGVYKNVGLFDENNGIMLRMSGTTMCIVTRTYTSGAMVETVIPQSSWNIDQLNGAGPSGYTINPALTQIGFIDYEYLGVGRIRIGISTDTQQFYIHQITNVNQRVGAWASKSNFPIRYQIINGVAQSSAPIMSMICADINTESSQIQYPTVGITGPLAGVAGTTSSWIPIATVRVNSNYARGGNIRPLNYWALNTTTNTTGTIGVFLNPQANISTGTWVSVTNSAVQYNNTITGALTITNTTCVLTHTDSVAGGQKASGLAVPDPYLWGGFDYTQTIPDIWVLAVYTNAGTGSWIGGMDIQEVR